MAKLGVVITSFSGKEQSELKSYNIELLPLQIIIDDQHYLEGFYNENVNPKILVEKFINSKTYSTSLTPIEFIQEQMERLSKENDYVLYIPIDGDLSGTCDILKVQARNFENVKVFDNHLSGSSIFRLGLEAKKMFEQNNCSIDEIMEFLNWFNINSVGYIIPKTLDAFIKGGRLKGIKKAILTTMNITPIIKVGLKLEMSGMGRSKKSCAKKVIEKLLHFIKEVKINMDDFEVTINWAFDESVRNDLLEELNKSILNNLTLHKEFASIITLMHTGYGACYLGVNPKASYELFITKYKK